MEFYDVVNKRRSIRQFEDKEISKEVLERILDAGLKAPSSNHQRQWELAALTDKHMFKGLQGSLNRTIAALQNRKRLNRKCSKSHTPANAA